ncbi:MAG TPA: MFS transporter [Anaerolineae bacterium]|nr:MFS transporter [Anaerolineae bacterium]
MTEAPARRLHWYEHIWVNANWFALTLRAQVLAGLVVPLLVQNYVGEGQKGSYYGTIRLWALMMAVLTQALFGLLSDHYPSRWGRRRPFVVIGTLAEVVVFALMAWVAGLSGMTGFYLLLVLYLLSMLASNYSQGGTQGLIPDVVPPEQRGTTSGVKMLLEIPLPLVLVGLVIAPMVSQGRIGLALAVTAAGMLVCMGLTLLVHEESSLGTTTPIDWKPLLSLVWMTVVFTAIILGLGWVVKVVMAALGSTSRLVLSLVGVLAMVVAVIAGIFGSLAVHSDPTVRRSRPFIWWTISRLAALVAVNNIASFLLYFLQDKFTLPAQEAVSLAGLLPMVLGGFVVLFGLVAGWLSDRFDRRWMTALGAGIGALGVVVIVLGPSIAWMYVAAAIIGLAYALFNVASWALGTDIIPTERAGEFLGLQNLAGAGAGAIGAYIGGSIADHTGYVWMMVMFGVMFVLSALTVLWVKEARPAG